MNIREVTTLLSLVLDPLAEMPAINLAWLGLDVTGKVLCDPVAKLIHLGVDPCARSRPLESATERWPYTGPPRRDAQRSPRRGLSDSCWQTASACWPKSTV